MNTHRTNEIACWWIFRFFLFTASNTFHSVASSISVICIWELLLKLFHFCSIYQFPFQNYCFALRGIRVTLVGLATLQHCLHNPNTIFNTATGSTHPFVMWLKFYICHAPFTANCALTLSFDYARHDKMWCQHLLKTLFGLFQCIHDVQHCQVEDTLAEG